MRSGGRRPRRRRCVERCGRSPARVRSSAPRRRLGAGSGTQPHHLAGPQLRPCRTATSRETNPSRRSRRAAGAAAQAGWRGASKHRRREVLRREKRPRPGLCRTVHGLLIACWEARGVSPDPGVSEAFERDGTGSLPIASYGLLSDCNSAALIGADGSIDWLCFPRFDSPALFSRLLGPGRGALGDSPARDYEVNRRYLDGTLVLETTFTTDGAASRLRDAMAFGRDSVDTRSASTRPNELLRLVEGISRHVELRSSWRRARSTAWSGRCCARPRMASAPSAARTRSSSCRTSLSTPMEAPRTLASGSPSRRPVQLRAALGRRPARTGADRDRPGLAAGAHRGDRPGLALLGGRARHLRGPPSPARSASARACSRR